MAGNPVRATAAGFGPGLSTIARHGGLELSVLRLAAGESWEYAAPAETALLLMSGKVSGAIREANAEPVEFAMQRASLFDESASGVHLCAGASLVLQARAETEFTLYSCANRRPFPVRVFRPEEVANEHRGAGQVAGRCLRFVRTIFDGRSAPPEAELVLGEVVNLPGGWSSYPPHHHDQPEIYHYRFTQPQGYGHAELGEEVFKVAHGDTLLIPAGLDHAQCAAPGYGMYYAWVIRHLPGNPYTVPEFTPEHAWTMDRDADFWWPRDLPRGD